MRLIIYFLIAFPIISAAQVKHDYFWITGVPDTDPSSFVGNIIMDFNGGQLNVAEMNHNMEMFLSNASICNQEGELLFYTNGCFINNSALGLMVNGDGLNPGVAYSTGNCPNYGNAVIQGAMILPLPGNEDIYYLFHGSAVSGSNDPVFLIYHGLLYVTIVDMEQGNGLGKVIEKNSVILEDTLSSDLHAVRHSNGTDWWVLVSQAHTNTHFKILFTSNGVEEIYEQQLGIDLDPWKIGSGQSCFSPDGTKFARYNSPGNVYLFDFDRGTGELSNFQYLQADTTEISIWGGLSFSPSSRYLYANSQLQLWQFDTEASDVQGSGILIDEYDGGTSPSGLPTYFFLNQLAPDCKIYLTCTTSIPYYHVINSPDEAGTACNFVQRGLELPAVNSISIPNFPNYRLGTGFPVCDSTIQLVTSTVRVRPPAQQVRVWPNPASGPVQVELALPLAAAGEWRLYGSMGQLVYSGQLAMGQTEHVFELDGVPPGLYFWEVRSEERRVGSGKLVMLEP